MLLIEDASLVDARDGSVQVGNWLVDESGLCKPHSTGHYRDNRLPAAGVFLLPGLIDAHVHLGRPRDQARSAPVDHVSGVARQILRGGVTSVRDLGDRWPWGAEVGRLACQLVAPRVISALSGITSAAGYGRFLGEAVRDAGEMVAAIRRRHKAGAKVIKLFLTGGVDFSTGRVAACQFDAPAIALAARCAHELGLSLAVHANGQEAVMAAVKAGADTIEHGVLIEADGLQMMADHNVSWVPTLTPLASSLKADANDPRSAGISLLARVLAEHQEAVARGFDLGITVLAGTDAGAPGVPHGCVIEEVEMFVRAGVPYSKALKAATIWPAQALGLSSFGDAGASGGYRDLLVLGANPLRDVGALKELRHVVVGGQIVVGDSDCAAV